MSCESQRPIDSRTLASGSKRIAHDGHITLGRSSKHLPAESVLPVESNDEDCSIFTGVTKGMPDAISARRRKCICPS